MSQTPPFVLHPPAAPAIPLVLDSPHSGEHYPDDFGHAPPRAIVRLAEDTHVARLYRRAPEWGATLIEASFPRAYIDANRSLDDLDPDMLGQSLAHAARRVAQDTAGDRASLARRAWRRADVRAQAHRR
jgi:N-formylglutamate amidohydrolase